MSCLHFIYAKQAFYISCICKMLNWDISSLKSYVLKHFLFPDERNLLQEQRVVPDARQPQDDKGSGTERGGGKRRPLLAGHATATLSD